MAVLKGILGFLLCASTIVSRSHKTETFSISPLLICIVAFWLRLTILCARVGSKWTSGPHGLQIPSTEVESVWPESIDALMP